MAELEGLDYGVMPLGGGEAGTVPTGVEGVLGAALVAPFGSVGVAGMPPEEPLGNAGSGSEPGTEPLLRFCPGISVPVVMFGSTGVGT